MRSIDDWYADRAHREDQDPHYDWENDDVRDPFVLGETPSERAWIPRKAGGRRTSSPSASGSWKPSRSNDSGIGHSNRDWRTAAQQWLKQNPRGSHKACRDALAAAGYYGISRKMVTELAGQISRGHEGTKRKSRKRSSKSEVYKPYVPRPIERSSVPQPRRVVCDACGLVVPESGFCRCG